MDKPLTGIRVLELARILAGPWAGQLLADLGAEVIKVERPEVGDDTRHWGPPFAADGTAAYFHACNRGKRSVAIDFEEESGRRQIRALASQADVLIENFKVGSLARYGLDYAALAALNPGLVYCSITGFGQNGPYASRAGYDFIIQGLGGAMSLTGEPDRDPQKAGVAYADLFTGIYSGIAILAALRNRDQTGVGAHIDMALLDCQVGVLANQALNWMVSGQTPHRMGNAHPNLVPYQVFKVADGEVIVAVGNDRQFTRLCELLGSPELASDTRFATNSDRVGHRDILIALLSAKIATRRKDEFSSALEAAGIPAGAINSVDAVFRDPQVVHRGLMLNGEIPSLACPIVIDGKRQMAEERSPALPVNVKACDVSALQWSPREIYTDGNGSL